MMEPTPQAYHERTGTAELGTATIDPPGPVVAGSIGTWHLTYVAGARGIDPGGSIRINTDSDSDWGLPQLHDPAAAEYLTCDAPSEAAITVVVHDHKSVGLLVKGRGLRPGARVTVTYGDRSGGGPGSRAQTFFEPRRYFWVGVDPDGSGRTVTLADSPALTITGGDAAGLVAVVPSTLRPGATFALLVRAVDAWGNPAQAYRGTISLAGNGIRLPVERHTFTAAEGGVWWLGGCVAEREGLLTVEVTDGAARLRVTSNPIRCQNDPGPYTLYWGDPHGGQVALAEKIPGFFRYGRDVAGIHFAGYQRNDHVVSRSDWEAQQAAEREFHEPGRFIPLPGFEWSAEPARGGHHNVYFRRHGLPIRRNSHRQVADRSDIDTDLPHILDVYRAYRGADVTITPHVGGAHADLTYHEPTLEPALEITSTHGTFEWFLQESLEHGYKMGFVGGSDSHDGRTGADTPGYQERRYAKGGLTGLYATELTLDAIHEALRARRCYATTGARMILDVHASGHRIGEEFLTASPPRLDIFVAGTAPIEAVEVFRGLARLHEYRPAARSSPRRLRVLWEGASRRTSYSGVIWEGALRLRGASIGAIETLRFDSPRSHMLEQTASSVRWYSLTCGYRSGLVLDLDGDPTDDAEIEVTLHTSLVSRPFFAGHGEEGAPRMAYAPADRITFRCGLRDLASGPYEVPIGLLNRKVTVSLIPDPGSQTHASFAVDDPSPHPGINPYWVRVVQIDQEMGWTSPIFVDFVAPAL